MDFGAIPPEINSARMYAGAGSQPFLAAASAWAAISAGLAETADGYRAVIAGLPWYGPSAAAMTASGTAYAQWLTVTAAQAETTAQQALAAAAAYETAFAAIVPPPVIAANRALLAALVATNLLGQNTAAIAAIEAQYGEMWAQDAAAMYGYQAASAAATQLAPFTPAPQTARPKSASSDAGQAPAGIVQQILGSLDNTTVAGQYLQAFVSSGPLQLLQLPIELLSMFSVLWALDSPDSPLTAIANGVARAQANASVTTPAAVPELPPVVAAGPGSAPRCGRLSVPSQWWAQPSPSATTPAPTVRALPAADTEVPMPFPLPLGAPRGGTPPKTEKPPPEYGCQVRFVPRAPSGG